MYIRLILFLFILSCPLYAQRPDQIECPSKKHILSKSFYSTANQLSSIHCQLDGEFDGATKSWHPDGKLKTTGSYIDGEMDGKWTRWHPNGKKRDEGIWVEGAPHGKWTRWHPNGVLHQEGRFLFGEKIGLWTIQDQEGKKEKADFRNSKSDYFLSLNPVSEILTYSTDWSDAQAKYATKDGFDLNFNWKYHFNDKWSSSFIFGMRQRKFEIENDSDSGEDTATKIGLGIEFKTKRRTYGLMLESFPDFYVGNENNSDPQFSRQEIFSHRNLSVRAHVDQFISKSRRYHWLVGVGARYLFDRSQEIDEIINDRFSQPVAGFGADLKLEAIYNSSTRRSYFVNIKGSYTKQKIKQVDTGVEFSTERINAGLTAGLRHNFGKENNYTAKERKNWINFAFVPVSELVTYNSKFNDSSATYASETAQDIIISWNRLFSKKWTGSLALEINKRSYENGGNQYLFDNKIDDGTSLIFGVASKHWGFHLGVKNQIVMRYKMSDGKIMPEAVSLPTTFITYNLPLFSWKKIDFAILAKASLLGPNIFDDEEEWMDEDGDGLNDNVIDAGIGFGGRIALNLKYKLSPHKKLTTVAFFDKEYQTITMRDSGTEFDVTKTTLGLGAQLSFLF